MVFDRLDGFDWVKLYGSVPHCSPNNRHKLVQIFCIANNTLIPASIKYNGLIYISIGGGGDGASTVCTLNTFRIKFDSIFIDVELSMYSRCRFKEQPHKLSCCALPNFVCIVYEIDEFRFFPFVPSFVRGVQHTLDKVKSYSRQFYLNIIIVIYCSCFLVSKIYVIWPCIYGYENELEFHYFFSPISTTRATYELKAHR